MLYISWVSSCVEQAHASLATLKKFHPHVEIDVLLARGLIHQLRSLILPEIEDRRVAMLGRQIENLHNRMPQKARGHGLFLKEFRAQVLEHLPASTKMSQHDNQKLFTAAMERWKKLPDSQKAGYRKKARTEAYEKYRAGVEKADTLQIKADDRAGSISPQQLQSF